MRDLGPGKQKGRSARRRHLTILFSDLSGYTSLAGTLEPEDCLRVVDHMRQCSERVVGKYGGTIIDFHGDGVLAMFGFPEPSEQDGRSATEAALDLHQAISEFPLTPLRLHTGVHSGLVLLIENDPSPGNFLLIGEVVPIAQRLSANARDDEILVSATTLGAEGWVFDVRERGHVALKGKTKPVAAIQVLGRATSGQRREITTRERSTPFVGRDPELRALHRHLDRVVEGGTREVAVVASAGMGKTRLVEHFLQQVADEGLQIYRGYCENYLGAEPLQPFLQVLRQTESGEARARSTEVADAVVDSLASLAKARPVVLFIDDWQWADDATKQALSRLRELQPASMLIVVASRESGTFGLGPNSSVIELQPLDGEEATQAIVRLRPDLDPLAAQHIQHVSGGNPLFLEELCHSAESETSDRASDADDGLPAWLGRLIASRVGRLPARHAAFVRDAAVIGAVIPSWLLQAVTGCEADDPMFAELAAADFIYEAPEAARAFRFKHEITRDVIYASVGRDERRSLHRRIAALLEGRASGDGSPESLLAPLSHHSRAGGDLERAAHYAELAGDEAMSAGAADKARSQYFAALQDLEALPDFETKYNQWSRIAHRFGLACVFDPARSQLATFARFTELARQHDDDAGLARSEYWRGFIQYALGEAPPAIEHYDIAHASAARAKERAEAAGDRALVAEMSVLGVQLLAAMGQARAIAGEHDAALAMLEQALAVKRQHRRKGRAAVGSAYALACKGAVLGDLGRFGEAYECFDEALEAVQVGHPAVEGSVVGWRSAVNLWQGDWQQALESALRSQGLAQRVGSLYVLAMGRSVAAYARWMTDRDDRAADVIERATSWLEARDERLSISLSYGWLSDIYATSARRGDARRCATMVFRRAHARDTLGAPMAYRALASLATSDEYKNADFYLRRAMESSLRRSPREQAVTLLHQARHAVREGRAAEAIPLLERARETFIAMSMRWHDAEAHRAWVEANGLQGVEVPGLGNLNGEQRLTRN